MARPFRKGPQSKSTQGIHLPAPIGGVNALMGASAMGPTDAITMTNMVPGEYGARVRDGYAEFATGMVDEVRTIMSFGGSAEADDRLFAVTTTGIFNITAGGAVGAKVASFTPTTDPGSGWGSWTNFITTNSGTTASANFLIYCDEVQGTWFYNVTPGVWTKAVAGDFTRLGSGAAPSPNAFVAVVIWKNRVWYVERNTGHAWYTKVGLYKGEMSLFDFGNKFTMGGYLLNLWNWTVDGGAGIDDYLVGIGSKGDVVIYQGSDPTVVSGDYYAVFGMKGVWQIGQPPKGRRICTVWGGDLLAISQRGIVPLSRLLSGQAPENADLYSSKKISGYMTGDMEQTINEYGWEMAVYPRRNQLIVNTPKEWGRYPGQYAMFLPTTAWGFLRNLPASTWANWKNKTYMGTVDGRVCVFGGGQDNVTIAAGKGVDVEWSMLTSFSDWGAPAQNKRGHFVRPLFLADTSKPTYAAEFRFDFNLSGIASNPAAVPAVGALWDVGLWDSAVWGGGIIFEQQYYGGLGFGQHGAIALRGSSSADTVLVGFDILFDVGGYL